MFRRWQGMQRRCNDPKERSYPDYGGRGIKVCERWADVTKFVEDMGMPPSPRHSIDRIDNDGNYEPANCRWATIDVQNKNRRSTHWVSYDGVTLTLRQWAERANIHETTLCVRLQRMPVEKALFGPRRASPQRKPT